MDLMTLILVKTKNLNRAITLFGKVEIVMIQFRAFCGASESENTNGFGNLVAAPRQRYLGNSDHDAAHRPQTPWVNGRKKAEPTQRNDSYKLSNRESVKKPRRGG
jgi:hypothetical protein